MRWSAKESQRFGARGTNRGAVTPSSTPSPGSLKEAMRRRGGASYLCLWTQRTWEAQPMKDLVATAIVGMGLAMWVLHYIVELWW